MRKRGAVPPNAVRQRSIRGTYFGVNAGGARTPEENERQRAREFALRIHMLGPSSRHEIGLSTFWPKKWPTSKPPFNCLETVRTWPVSQVKRSTPHARGQGLARRRRPAGTAGIQPQAWLAATSSNTTESSRSWSKSLVKKGYSTRPDCGLGQE